MMRARTLAIILPVAIIVCVSVATAKGFFKTGEQAPGFTLTTVTGEPLALDSLKGKVVVMGLFHICDPCMQQGTNLQKVYEATKGKEVAVIGINSSGNSKKEVLEFLSAFPVKVTYPYGLDPGKTTDKLYGGGRFIPNVYILDRQGVIRWQRVGNMELAGSDVILAEVDKLLAEPPKKGTL